MTTAAATLPTETVIRVPLERLKDSPTNPRKHLGDLSELADSIKQVGVLEPLVARAKGKDYELVFGHRRAAAARKADTADVPVIVREYSDDEVLECQITENSQRADCHPLDEADGFKALIKRGYDVARIAARIGRPATYVAQRLKLCELSKEARKALDSDKISLSVAVMIARIPAQLQDEAMEDLVDYGDGQVSVAEAKRTLEGRYLLRLDQAPFDIADAKLVPKAGACTACPKRTGQQRELFPDAARADLCTDPVCHKGKVEALWQIRKKEAQDGGAQTLEGKEAQNALRYGSSFRKLDDTEYLGGGKQKTVRQILGKERPPTTLARGEDGQIVELVRRVDVDKVLKRKAPERDKGGDDYQAREKARARKLVLKRKAITLAITQAVEKGAKLAPMDVLHLVVRAFAARVWSEVQRAILERRGIEAKGGNVEKLIVKLATDFDTNGDILGLGLELAMRSGAPWNDSFVAGTSATWKEALELTGVNFEAIEKSVAVAAKEKKKAPKGKGAKADKPAATKKPAKPKAKAKSKAGSKARKK